MPTCWPATPPASDWWSPPRRARPWGGFGDGVLDALNQAGVRAPVLKIALAEGFVDHGAVDDLRRQQRIDVPGIVGRIGEALGVEARPTTAGRPTSTAA